MQAKNWNSRYSNTKFVTKITEEMESSASRDLD